MKVKVAVWVFPGDEWEVAGWGDEDAACYAQPGPAGVQSAGLPCEGEAEKCARDGGQLRIAEVEVEPWSVSQSVRIKTRTAITGESPPGPSFLCEGINDGLGS